MAEEQKNTQVSRTRCPYVGAVYEQGYCRIW
jgi:hypothetical protein